MQTGSTPPVAGADTIDAYSDDPLDAYMREIAGEAAPQVALPATAPANIGGATRSRCASAAGASPGGSLDTGALMTTETPDAAVISRVGQMILDELGGTAGMESIVPAEFATALQREPQSIIQRYGHQISDKATAALVAAHAGCRFQAELMAAVRSRDRVRRNRRYAALQSMLKGEDTFATAYFSDVSMEQRDPALFRELMRSSGAAAGLQEHEEDEDMDEDGGATSAAVGRQAASAAQALLTSARGSLLTFGARVGDLDRLAESEMARERREQAEAATMTTERQATALSSMFMSAMDGSNTCAPDALVEEISEQRVTQMTPANPAMDEAARRRELVHLMAERFLRGDDAKHFEYAKVDRDSMLDASRENEMDAEERYFA